MGLEIKESDSYVIFCGGLHSAEFPLGDAFEFPNLNILSDFVACQIDPGNVATTASLLGEYSLSSSNLLGTFDPVCGAGGEESTSETPPAGQRTSPSNPLQQIQLDQQLEELCWTTFPAANEPTIRNQSRLYSLQPDHPASIPSSPTSASSTSFHGTQCTWASCSKLFRTRSGYKCVSIPSRRHRLAILSLR